MITLHSVSNASLAGFVSPNSRAYFHGKLEEMFHYDLFEVNNCPLIVKRVRIHKIFLAKLPLGIYQVKVLGVEEPCTIFSWISKWEEEQKSLVVLNSDLHSFNYARKCFEESRDNI